MPEQIDDAAYEAGKVSFIGGVSLRVIVQSVMDRMNAADLDRDADLKTISFALGFADALINRLRSL